MQLKSTVVGLAAATVTLASFAGNAHAQALTTFASVDTLGQVFQFLNSGSASTFGLTSASIPVTFKYKVANGYGGINTDVSGTMTLTSNVTNGSGGYFQDMNSIFVSITANTAVDGKTNLLSMAATTGLAGATGQLTSGPNFNIANFGGDTSVGQSVGFSSDFLDFTQTNDRSFNFALNSLTPRAGTNGNGYMNSFTAAGIGNFASDPAPTSTTPEPGTLALLALAALPGGALIRRKRAK